MMRRYIFLAIIIYLLVLPVLAKEEALIPLGKSDSPMLIIPSLDIVVPITTFYLGGGSWEIDPWEDFVGHLEGTSWIDSAGNVVLAGHSEHPNGSAGIFFALDTIEMGETIIVQEGNLIRRYEVVDIRSVDYRDLSVVYPATESRLTLITCSIPSYVAEQGLYYERLVVIADEVSD
jgi:LPXTG-site transpeptidase (sortase) family protein